MSDCSPQVIKAQMATTRSSLAEKIETLEERVVHSMHDANDVLHETIDSAREVVHDTVATVKSTMASTGDMVKSSVTSVKDTFDVPLQVERHPWSAVGTAAIAGFALGSIGETGSRRTSARCENLDTNPKNEPHDIRTDPASLNSPTEPSADNRPARNVSKVIANHLEPLKSFAIGAVMASIQNVLAKGLHEEWRRPLFEAIDDITLELGGRPLKPAGSAGAEKSG